MHIHSLTVSITVSEKLLFGQDHPKFCTEINLIKDRITSVIDKFYWKIFLWLSKDHVICRHRLLPLDFFPTPGYEKSTRWYEISVLRIYSYYECIATSYIYAYSFHMACSYCKQKVFDMSLDSRLNLNEICVLN